MVDIEKFKSKIRPIGDSKCVIIPNHIITFSGVKEGDYIEVWFRKLNKKELEAIEK